MWVLRTAGLCAASLQFVCQDDDAFLHAAWVDAQQVQPYSCLCFPPPSVLLPKGDYAWFILGHGLVLGP